MPGPDSLARLATFYAEQRAQGGDLGTGPAVVEDEQPSVDEGRDPPREIGPPALRGREGVDAGRELVEVPQEETLVVGADRQSDQRISDVRRERAGSEPPVELRTHHTDARGGGWRTCLPILGGGILRAV